MSLQTYHEAYQATQRAAEDPRQTEYRLFAKVTRALMDGQESNGRPLVDAIHWNRRLWLTLQADLASEENRLPDELKAQLISLSIWVDKHSSKVLRGTGDVEPMIAVNRSIMEGLAGQP